MFKKIIFCGCFFSLLFANCKGQNKEIVFAHTIDTISFQGIKTADSAQYIIASKTIQCGSNMFGGIQYAYFDNDTLYALIASEQGNTSILCQLDAKLTIIKYKEYVGNIVCDPYLYQDEITFFQKKIICYRGIISDRDKDYGNVVLYSLGFNNDTISKNIYNYADKEGGSFLIPNADTLSLITIIKNKGIRVLKFGKTLNKLSERLIKDSLEQFAGSLIDEGNNYLMVSGGLDENYSAFPIFSKFDKNGNYLSSKKYSKKIFNITHITKISHNFNVSFSDNKIYFFNDYAELKHTIFFRPVREGNYRTNEGLKIENNIYFLSEYRTNLYLLKYNLNTQKMEWKLKLYRYNYGYQNLIPLGMFIKDKFLFIYGAKFGENISNLYPELLKIKL